MMDALIIVDVQNDFLSGGALEVPDGHHVIPVINQIASEYALVACTQDWHPTNHGSFASQHPGTSVGDVITLNGLDQVLWPDHCVQGTWGAEFSRQLDPAWTRHVFEKGTDPAVDSYSGFFDNGRRSKTGLDEFLRIRGVTQITVAGLATDYCVKFTALDGRSLGFDVSVVQAGCRGVNLQPGDIDAAVREMQSAGIKII
jgi:nicotinamidase/pyrazinamidase